ncbi:MULTISPECIES: dihydrolipoamide acetyltransferase family protein [Bacillus]|uniref:Dihydrolipoamide acetyltransferase component of pyruvate dehydrogenase complex n=1 Tax=Bacillus aerius TaxID=293388 RepID=A0ABR6B592_9BACI|nr:MULTISPECIES: dihydrolipoamide acetyltransferase family protein [Bacillus]KOA81591.1 branched-chain alpha-keto acid dehydrogenase subunit E2 [Bacillus stratosphericus]MDH8711568.1 pyruvate dehydrogenase E2 component (dihydrolipoamide acetyltransferase) [Micromonospora sp. 1209]BAT47654.1 branched-chain alpha-keto acid dehydrogenase subunit E2 [Bacillus pumilus]KAJ0072062.1 2-oxo acid dehydrogenase subunit E2 [Bacillus altitudinis]MBA8919311.1 pyruvate dehydrogenase E2 component (dihydrolipo
MAVEVVMPKLGMSMKEGTVSVWNKEVGETVNKGESIASINSEKIEIEIESPAEGTILDIKVPEGEGVPPGTVICYIGEGNEQVERKKEKEIQSKPKKERKKISPVARKMANSANLDIDTLVGTGPGGRITKEDVLRALPERKEKKQNETVQQPINMMRKTIASRMMESLQTSAQLTITMKADVTKLTNLQQQLNETAIARYETKLTITDFVAKAVILSLLEHPAMNSQYHNGVVETFENVHLGIAAALDNGLAVPVIRHAERLTLIELAKGIKLYGKKAREGKLLHDEIKGSTFTITNLGAYGVEHFTPILNPPEAGILGVGTMYDTPVYREDELCKGTILPLSLTFDHRVLDGAPASAFLSTVKAHLEEPISILL